MTIYTKKGDKGETGLFTDPDKAKRVSKDSPRISAIGAIDELNSFLGIVISFSRNKNLNSFLKNIQRDLFSAGSILAGANLVFKNHKTIKLERVIDQLEKEMPPLKNFIVPGGTKVSSLLQYCRSVCRRSERAIVSLSKEEKVQPEILRFINRLSDTIFMLARKNNFDAKFTEDVWHG